MYAKLLDIAVIDQRIVKPVIVHNYIHILYFGYCYKDIMSREYLDETIDILLDGFINYIF